MYVVATRYAAGVATYLRYHQSGGRIFSGCLPYAIRNTLLFGLSVAVMSRIVALVVGLLAGYKGGWVDRLLMSINDTFIVIPLLPILVLFYFVMRDKLTWGWLALIMALLGWAYDARLIRSIAISLRDRDFTRTSVFSGMTTREILQREHMPYVLPIVFSTTLNNINWSIGLEVTLAVLGFTDINTPSIGGMIYWANQHTAMVAGIWWWIAFPVMLLVMVFIGLYLLAVSMNEFIDPRSRLSRMGGALMRVDTSSSPVLSVHGLKAYYRTTHFGINREVKAVDGVDFDVQPNEIYGLAGESSSGKTTLIKTIAAALKPPLEIVAGRVDFAFAPDILKMKSEELDRLRWRHLSYIVQGSMSVFNPVRRIRQSFIDFAFRHTHTSRKEFDQLVESHLARGRSWSPVC